MQQVKPTPSGQDQAWSKQVADEEFSVKKGGSAAFMCPSSARQMCALANALLAHTAVGFLGISYKVLASPL